MQRGRVLSSAANLSGTIFWIGLAIFIGLLEGLFVENIYLRTIYKK